MTAQNYEKPGLSQARAFCILGTSPLPIGKWATSNLILVQQKRRSKSKDKRDASGRADALYFLLYSPLLFLCYMVFARVKSRNN